MELMKLNRILKNEIYYSVLVAFSETWINLLAYIQIIYNVTQNK